LMPALASVIPWAAMRGRGVPPPEASPVGDICFSFLSPLTAGPLCSLALHLPTGCAVLRSVIASPGQGRDTAYRYSPTPPTAPRRQDPAQQHNANNDNDNDSNDDDNDRQQCRAARAEGRSAAASAKREPAPLHPTRIAP
jgi:hypothetical protein